MIPHYSGNGTCRRDCLLSENHDNDAWWDLRGYRGYCHMATEEGPGGSYSVQHNIIYKYLGKFEGHQAVLTEWGTGTSSSRSIEDSSEVPQVWRLRSEGSWTSHNGSVNFLGDGPLWELGTVFRDPDGTPGVHDPFRAPHPPSSTGGIYPTVGFRSARDGGSGTSGTRLSAARWDPQPPGSMRPVWSRHHVLAGVSVVVGLVAVIGRSCAAANRLLIAWIPSPNEKVI